MCRYPLPGGARAVLRGWMVLLAGVVIAGAAAADRPSFTRDVQPILSNNCYACHGFDEAAREAGLRLDVFEAATAARDRGAAIVPGDPDASLIVQRISESDPARRMPPGEHDTLSEAQIETIRQWIAAGADYEPHWSFQPPVRPEVPAVEDGEWPRNALDHFILARLEAEGFAPSPRASKETLLRRLSLDLTGLPPTPEEIADFLNDTSSVAYEKVVERLLASPRFGEHWARSWLDIARFADTKGYEADRHRDIWQYRDWVIQALNADMPYDQFTLEQLAGDLLPAPTEDQIIATAFHRNTMTNDEGGTDNEEFRSAAVVDRVNTTAEAWMGLTMSCAQCHSHKYDPISHREYFQLYAFFNQTADNDQFPIETPVFHTPDEAQRVVLAALDQGEQRIEQRLAAQLKELSEERRQWEQGVLAYAGAPPVFGDWHVVGPFEAPSFDEAFETAFPPEEAVDLLAVYEGGALAWEARPEWVDGQIHQLPGDIVSTYLYRSIESDLGQPLELSLGSNDSIKVWLNGEEVLAHHVPRGAEADQERITVFLQPGKNDLLMKIVNAGGGHAFYFKVMEAGFPEGIVSALESPRETRSPEQQREIDTYYASIAPELAELREARAQLESERKEKLEEVAFVPVMEELPPEKHRETRIHLRGNYLDLGEQVEPGTPAILPPFDPELPRNRLGLAQWLTSEEHPLTARVAVNRIWYQIFGVGIVETLEDFGIQGELPSHPELLDWLATEYIQHGWSTKDFLRLIVMSATYQQDSRMRPELREQDPYNRLLARAPRFRLPAEGIRDQALAISGLLSDKMYGPSVKPPQPDGIWMVVYNNEEWETSTGEDRYRRGLYTYLRRTSPYPSMQTFDATPRDICTSRRSSTNTPLQALVTLNDPVYIEAAQALARQCAQEVEALSATLSKAEREEALVACLERVFQRALVRTPKPGEVEQLAALYHDSLAYYAEHREDAVAMATDPIGPAPEDRDMAELAAWTVVCNVILNLDELLMKL